MEVDGTLESRLILLRKDARQLSTRDLCEEFCLYRISSLVREWGASVNKDEEVLGLPRLVLPSGAEREFFFYLSTFFFGCEDMFRPTPFFYSLFSQSAHWKMLRQRRRRWSEA